MREKLIAQLNNSESGQRLEALKKLSDYEKGKGILPVFNEQDANNHIHTIYSFSPYSPAMAAYRAYSSGLKTMGIMDHDTLGGAKEFIEACKILGTSCTVGFETRVHIKGYDFGRINNPDQKNHMYMAVHGVPHQNIDALNDYLSFFRSRRNMRNRLMVKKINEKFDAFGINIDFDKDVYQFSAAKENGTITERHLLFALSKKIYEKFVTGEKVTEFLQKDLGIKISEKVKGFLCDKDNKFRLYDLLGALKSDTGFFYIPADEESPEIEDLVGVAKCMGAITAYPYLGDVGDSVTGDKKAQEFEDGYLDELFKALKKFDIDAVAYMPTRNTEKQLKRVMGLCEKYDFFEISGEDINSPRQKFECPILKNPLYSNLVDSAWALIGHEKCATKNLYDGMFTPHTKKRFPDLRYRIKVYAEIGRNF